MITRWYGIAPFDNVDGVGFEAAYPPEAEFVREGTVDLSATYPGKTDRVAWQEVEASDKGVVDLAAAYNKEKGAVCYLYAEFEAPERVPAGRSGFSGTTPNRRIKAAACSSMEGRLRKMPRENGFCR